MKRISFLARTILITLGITLIFTGFSFAHTTKRGEVTMKWVKKCAPFEERVDDVTTIDLFRPKCLIHTPKRGDTLASIAHYYSTREQKVTVEKLKELNPQIAGRPNRIYLTDQIVIPFVSEAEFWTHVQLRRELSINQENKYLGWKLQEVRDRVETFFVILIVLAVLTVLLSFLLIVCFVKLLKYKRIAQIHLNS